MELTQLRQRIDTVDCQLIELLEQRMDVSAAIAGYKLAHGVPVLDAGREADKLSAVRAACRPETAELIAGLFADIMAASRTYQTTLTEAQHGE